jgi:hypothetical protein
MENEGGREREIGRLIDLMTRVKTKNARSKKSSKNEDRGRKIIRKDVRVTVVSKSCHFDCLSIFLFQHVKTTTTTTATTTTATTAATKSYKEKRC